MKSCRLLSFFAGNFPVGSFVAALEGTHLRICKRTIDVDEIWLERGAFPQLVVQDRLQHLVAWPLTHPHEASIPVRQETREVTVELQADQGLLVYGQCSAMIQFEALIEMPQRRTALQAWPTARSRELEGSL